MHKKPSTLRITAIAATKKRLGEIELSEVQLKQISAGVACQGGTSTFCDDCDA